MQEYEIFKGRSSTTFTGELLAAVSSQDETNKLRWTEYEIYRTKAGNYVIVIYGKTTKPGEKLKTNIIESSTPQGVLEALKFKNKQGNIYLTITAEKALEIAAQNDEGLNAIYNHNHIE